jgi:hypothetical protein
MNSLDHLSICTASTLQIVEGIVSWARRVVRMNMELRDYEFDGADVDGFNGGWKFEEPLEEVFDPLANNIVQNDFAEGQGVMA